ncbi:calcium-activated potassium channel subunit beta-3-like [Oryzias latipes]|uniref:calcium-activated potassium channel subunit beta-3-like n=1 Tax=Oryzias latipes TaxID=8090 RepID=UPI000CE17D13|nr:calcium-activated potassium channel subunit beta-3-like [Oryzias latipes]
MQERDHWGEGHQDQGARTQKQSSSIGEDRAILLGFTMMAFSVLMFFVVGITAVKPFINSHWEENSSCVLQQTAILERWVDCRGVSSMPCLTVTVYINGSVDEVFLHLDEESVFLPSVVSACNHPVFHCSPRKFTIVDSKFEFTKIQTHCDHSMRFWSLGASRHFLFETLGGRGHSVRFSYKANDSDTESSDGNAFLPLQCFYIPNCQLSHEELHKEVQIVENNLTGHQGSTFPCFSSQKPYLSHAILRRKYTLSRTLFCLLWPCLMLVGGVALVGLVKLTQWLGRLSSRAGSEAARCRGLADTEGVLYRLLQGSSPQSPT